MKTSYNIQFEGTEREDFMNLCGDCPQLVGMAADVLDYIRVSLEMGYMSSDDPALRSMLHITCLALSHESKSISDAMGNLEVRLRRAEPAKKEEAA